MTTSILAVSHDGAAFYHVAIIPGLTRGLVRTSADLARADAQAFGAKAIVKKLLPSQAAPLIQRDRKLHSQSYYELQVPTRH